MSFRLAVAAVAVVVTQPLLAQSSGRFPPDSLVNTKVIASGTPVIQVIGMMRNFAGALGVRCQYCHVGEEGRPLGEFDFATDRKRTKLVARQMMLMVQEINRRLDTVPGRAQTGLQVVCATCHRGLPRPQTLAAAIAEMATAAGADSAIRAYRALRTKYFGRDAYDFGEPSLNTAAFRLGRDGRFEDALAILAVNEEMFPGSSGMAVFRGNILLMKGDSTGAAAAFREAIRRDPTNDEARGRLKTIGRDP